MESSAQGLERPVGRLRYLILTLLFIATTINYADRATLSIAGAQMQARLGLSVVSMGYLFSAFGWSYVVARIPCGWLLDRYGSRRVYLLSILVWSVLGFAQGAVGFLRPVGLVAILFVLRLGVGMAEAPVFPGNSRIVAAWFPTGERGTAAAVFNSAQYFAPVAFAPLQAWITHRFGWECVYFFMGAIALALLYVWRATVYSPRRHTRISAGELDYIAAGGAQVDMEEEHGSSAVRWRQVSRLLRSRMLVGVYIAQYCITTLTYFFLTWFPIYLIKQRGMSILTAGFVTTLPAICGFVGGVLGGILSDALLRRGFSLTVARKLPIIVGLMLSTVMIACNFVATDWLVVAVMSLAFFGKGIGALGWAVVADTSPRRMAGLSGALFNTFGNTAAITTPIIIGYIVATTGSFGGALVFVVANAVVAVLSYTLVVGPITRLELDDSGPDDGIGMPRAVKL